MDRRRAQDVKELEDQESSCCVCFLPTDDRTPCGHTLCRECQVAIKSKLCPVCRRALGPLAPIDFEALLRTAAEGDLGTLQRAYRRASSVPSAEAKRAKVTLTAYAIERLQLLRTLPEFSAALALLPLSEPTVLALAKQRIDAGARQVCNVAGLAVLVSELQGLREESAVLTPIVDRAVMEAAQRVVAGLSLRQLEVGAADLAEVWRQPGIDTQLLTFSLQEALTHSLDDEFTQDVARAFACAAKALTAKRLVDESTEGYVASLFAARMSSFISAASFGDVEQVEAEVLPRLPRTPAWREASLKILRDIERQTKVLRHIRSSASPLASPLSASASASAPPPSSPQRHRSLREAGRPGRVDAFAQEMVRIDAGIALGLGQGAPLGGPLPPVVLQKARTTSAAGSPVKAAREIRR